ncbi:MAG: hypothetical protein QF535_16055 [Anaerolineales bacterium]|nr:hypothetical protein [Anaerolineales bacterium]
MDKDDLFFLSVLSSQKTNITVGPVGGACQQIEGVKHVEEIAFTRAAYQQDAVTTTEF